LEEAGRGSTVTVVQVAQPGHYDLTTAQAVPHDGDPRQYVGHPTQAGDGPVVNDDFLHYGPDGQIKRAIPAAEMNSAQRAAYLRWLRDPAIQQHIGAKLLDEAGVLVNPYGVVVPRD
jgi:hypothetical protein